MIHVNRAGTSLGVFSEEDVRSGLRSGRFVPTDLGWSEGMAQWQPLSQFSQFAGDAPTAASPPPPISPPSTSIPPAGGLTAAAAAGPGVLPWDERHARGFFNAFFETLMLFLGKPVAAFTAMKREGGFAEPLIYAVVGGSFGTVIYVIYNIFFRSLGMFASHRNDYAHHMISGGIGILVIILVPLCIVIGAFITSAILHVCLMLLGGAKRPFEASFRVVCFVGGSVNPLLIVPFCGAFIAVIWKIVLYSIGLAHVHETDTGRAVLAVLLPIILCCGGLFVILLMAGALGAWGLSQH
jgi:hypothetical protein